MMVDHRTWNEMVEGDEKNLKIERKVHWFAVNGEDYRVNGED